MSIEAVYYEQSQLWDPLPDRERDRVAIRMAETVSAIPAGVHRMLDVGSGNGLLIGEVRKDRPDIQVVGAERSLMALQQVDGFRVAADAGALPFPNDSFDLVSACEILEHLPVGTYESALTELARVSRRYILITVPNNENRRRSRVECPLCGCIFSRNWHLRSFAEDALAALFEGFELPTVKEIGPLQSYYPRAVLRFAKRLRVIPSRMYGSPICPQCGWRWAAGETGAHNGRSHSPATLPQKARAVVRPALPLLRRALARRGRPWLLAIYERQSTY